MQPLISVRAIDHLALPSTSTTARYFLVSGIEQGPTRLIDGKEKVRRRAPVAGQIPSDIELGTHGCERPNGASAADRSVASSQRLGEGEIENSRRGVDFTEILKRCSSVGSYLSAQIHRAVGNCERSHKGRGSASLCESSIESPRQRVDLHQVADCAPAVGREFSAQVQRGAG